MGKFKIHINKPDPDDNRINKHKDFKKLRHSYEKVTRPIYKTPLYKNPKVFLTLLLIIIVAYLVSEAIEREKKIENKLTPTEERPEK